MKPIIQSLRVSVASTTALEYRASDSVQPSSAPSSFTATFDAGVRASRRNGQMQRSAARELRERTDPEYHARMVVARVQLAEEFVEHAPLNLAQVRLSKGMTQTELAKKMDTSQSHIAKIEAGTVELYFKTAIKLSAALGISLTDLSALGSPAPSAPKHTSTVITL